MNNTVSNCDPVHTMVDDCGRGLAIPPAIACDNCCVPNCHHDHGRGKCKDDDDWDFGSILPIIIIVVVLCFGGNFFGGGSHNPCDPDCDDRGGGGLSWLVIIVVIFCLFQGDGGFLGGLFD